MVDHPLRVLAACAQIGVGMWRRNGMGALSQLVNYASPPLCTRLRDLDLTMLQYALATLDGADVLAAVLLRFGWLDQALAAAAGEEAANALRSSVSAGGRSLLEGHEALTAMDVTSESAVRGRLLEEAFGLLIVGATQLPPPPGDAALEAALRREIVHKLAVAPCSRSELAECIELVRGAKALCAKDASRFDAILTEVATKQGGGTPSAFPNAASRAGIKYELKAAAVGEFDEEFYHTAFNQHKAAAERLLAMRGKKEDATPAVGPPPAAHPFFARARRVLYEPLLIALLRSTLAGAVIERGRDVHVFVCVASQPLTRGAAGDDDNDGRPRCEGTLLSRALHLLTLQLHCLASADAAEADAFFSRLRAAPVYISPETEAALGALARRAEERASATSPSTQLASSPTAAVGAAAAQPPEAPLPPPALTDAAPVEALRVALDAPTVSEQLRQLADAARPPPRPPPRRPPPPPRSSRRPSRRRRRRRRRRRWRCATAAW